jgi:hypothetical protein
LIGAFPAVNPRKTQRGSCRPTEGLAVSGEAENRLEYIDRTHRVSEGVAADGGVVPKRRITCIPSPHRAVWRRRGRNEGTLARVYAKEVKCTPRQPSPRTL